MAADLVELRMNVAALKRVDPYIKDILGTATQVALYTFSALKNEWEKTEVEGALFVCSRNGEPYNSILIMNRLNTNNLVEPIVKDLDWQMQAPFLLYRNPGNSIYGIWFYNRDECVKTTYLLESIMESLTNNQEKMKAKRPTVGADIFSMLSKAQEDFNKTPVKSEPQICQPQSSTPRAPDVTSQSVMDFFAKASTTKTNPTPARLPTGDNEPLQPLLHRLMSNPAHSVEHIEKQQRAVTPQEQQSTSALRNKSSQPRQDNRNRNSGVLNLHAVSPSAPVESTFIPQELQTASVLRNKPSQPRQDGRHRNSGIILHALSSPATESVPKMSASAPINIERNNQSLIENGLNFMRIASPTTSSSPRGSFYLQQPVTEDPEPRTLSPPLAMLLDNPQKPALMPPMMFATTAAPKEKQEVPPLTMVKPVDCSPEQPEPLTRKQMTQAFHYLLKNDPEFVTKLHEAYVKSFSEMVS